MPLVSVIMPVYNQKVSYLKDAIDSILNQTLRDFELILVDDGSTNPGCVSTLKEYEGRENVLLLRNSRNFGIVYSLNRAIDTASGLYIARMDSDDISLPLRLERQVMFLEQNKEYDLVGSWAEVIDETGQSIGSLTPPTKPEKIRSIILRENPIIHPTWMFRRSLVKRVGKYDPTAINTEDYEFLLRIAKRCFLANIPEKLLKYRFNTRGLSFQKNKLQEKNAILIRIRSLKKYGYPKWKIVQILRPLVFYLFIPPIIKKFLLRISFHKGV